VKRGATLLAATGILAATSACGSSHRAQLSSNGLGVRSAASGHRYSVRDVRRAFAALGLELHRGPRPAPGLVSLVNNARLGPQHIPSPLRAVTVFVTTRRRAAARVQFKTDRDAQVTRYANVTVVLRPGVLLYQVRSAVSALRWGIASSSAKPGRGLIVLGSSIGGIRLDELRTNVEKAFGGGRSRRRGLVSYFGGHLIRQLLVPRRLVQAGPVSGDAVEWLAHSLRRPRRVKPTRAGSSLRDLRKGELRSPCWAVARPSGHRLHDATRQGRRHHHRPLRVTFANTGAGKRVVPVSTGRTASPASD
jgi:hypothetical protein